MVKHGGYDDAAEKSAGSGVSAVRLETDHAQLPGKRNAVSMRWGRTGSHRSYPAADTHALTGTLLSTLAPDGIRAVPKRIPARSVLFFKGDPATHLYVILSGRVKVSAPSDDGKEITFAILGPGDLVGEMGVLEQTDHTATVTAMEPTELAGFTRQDFLALVSQSPPLALKLLAVVCDRLRLANEMAEDISFLTLPIRLAKKLLALTRAFGQETPRGARVGIPLCQQELANMVGTSRESINKQLSIWHAEGIVTQDHGYLIVHRIEELALLTRSASHPVQRSRKHH